LLAVEEDQLDRMNKLHKDIEFAGHLAYAVALEVKEGWEITCPTPFRRPEPFQLTVFSFFNLLSSDVGWIPSILAAWVLLLPVLIRTS